MLTGCQPIQSWTTLSLQLEDFKMLSKGLKCDAEGRGIFSH